MREDDRADVLRPLPQEGEVGEDEVDPEVLVTGEGEAGVDHDDAALALDRGHVLADLAEAAKRGYARPGRAHRRSVLLVRSTSPAGFVEVTRGKLGACGRENACGFEPGPHERDLILARVDEREA